MSPKFVSIGFIAKRSGIAVSAVRYYADIGILHPYRNSSGQRQFLRSDIRRIAFIIAMQNFGFTLPQIKTHLARLPNCRTPTTKDWAALSQNVKQTLNHKITHLQKLRDTLDGCIGCGCLSLERCKLYNPDDRAGRHGSGARFLNLDPMDD